MAAEMNPGYRWLRLLSGHGVAASTVHRRVLRRTVAAVVGLIIVQGAAAAPASAHDSLLGSSPAAGAQVATAPSAVTLTFDRPVSTQFALVIVTGRDRASWHAGTPQVSGATVTQPLTEQAPAGAYEVAWRVVSGDGHPIAGTFGYVVTTDLVTTTPPSAGPVQEVTSSPAPVRTEFSAAPAAAGSPGSDPSWLPIAGILVALIFGLGIAAAAVTRRRRVTGG